MDMEQPGTGRSGIAALNTSGHPLPACVFLGKTKCIGRVKSLVKRRGQCHLFPNSLLY